MEKDLGYIESPVFILGHPKSGTSLVTTLLDSHPQLMVLPEESDFYSVIVPTIKSLNLQKKMREEEKKKLLLNKIFESTQLRNLFRGKVDKDISGNFDYSLFNTELFKSLITDNITWDLIDSKELFKNIIAAFSTCVYNNAQKSLLKYWVEKTPKHIYQLKRIQDEFPKAKFIFIYRDPRDNYISYYKKTGKTLTATAFSINWNKCFAIAEQIDKKKILFIKYEELITKPSAVINEIVTFLDIGKTDSLFQPTKLGFSWKGNSMFAEEKSKIDSSMLHRYRSLISNKDWCILEVLCKVKMQEYQYGFDKYIGFGMLLKSYYERMALPLSNLLFLCKKKTRSYFIEINKRLHYTIDTKTVDRS